MTKKIEKFKLLMTACLFISDVFVLIVPIITSFVGEKVRLEYMAPFMSVAVDVSYTP